MPNILMTFMDDARVFDSIVQVLLNIQVMLNGEFGQKTHHA